MDPRPALSATRWTSPATDFAPTLRSFLLAPGEACVGRQRPLVWRYVWLVFDAGIFHGDLLPLRPDPPLRKRGRPTDHVDPRATFVVRSGPDRMGRNPQSARRLRWNIGPHSGRLPPTHLKHTGVALAVAGVPIAMWGAARSADWAMALPPLFSTCASALLGSGLALEPPRHRRRWAKQAPPLRPLRRGRADRRLGLRQSVPQ